MYFRTKFFSLNVYLNIVSYQCFRFLLQNIVFYFKKIKLDKLLSKTDLDHLMGLEERKFLEAVLPEFTADQRALSYKQVVEIQYDLIDQQGGRIYEGVLKYIPLLSKKYKLFIISNCPKYTIDHFMKFAKINPYILDSISHGQNYKAKYQNMNRLIELTKAILVQLPVNTDDADDRTHIR